MSDGGIVRFITGHRRLAISGLDISGLSDILAGNLNDLCLWRYRLGVRTGGSQPSNRGSIPRTATNSPPDWNVMNAPSRRRRVADGDDGVDPPADEEVPFHRQPAGRTGDDKIVEDAVGDRLVKYSLLPE